MEWASRSSWRACALQRRPVLRSLAAALVVHAKLVPVWFDRAANAGSQLSSFRVRLRSDDGATVAMCKFVWATAMRGV
jgi:hypothetical protein